MLHVGLIGLGEAWEHRFHPALERLSQRIEVRCVYAAASSLAEQTAAGLGCDVAPGLEALIEREDVRSLLILDTDWQADVPVSFACRRGKPAFLARRLAGSVCHSDLLLRQSADAGITLMPELAHRYTPATSRLRELVATRLGRPLAIEIAAAPGSSLERNAARSAISDEETLAIAIDWCVALAGSAPTAVAPMTSAGTGRNGGPARQVNVEFRRPKLGGEATRATIHFHGEPPPVDPARIGSFEPVSLRIHVQCEKGTAILDPPHGISWETEGSRTTESLTSDRSAIEVMLDHFSRRVLGGLIPVPSLDDVRRAQRLARAAS